MDHSDEQSVSPATIHLVSRKKKRASKACSCCRTRKIRCDVLKTGVPCTKCQLDGFECVVQARKKRRGKNEMDKQSPSPGQDLTITGAARPSSPRSIPPHAMLHQVPHYPFFRSFAPDSQPSLLAVSQDPRRLSGSIKHSRLDEEDIQYLKRKGALSLPPKGVMDEFISNYFQLFHPFFPIIDKSNFLATYYRSDRGAASLSQGPSLLLLQTILFTASAVCNHSLFEKQGSGCAYWRFIDGAHKCRPRRWLHNSKRGENRTPQKSTGESSSRSNYSHHVSTSTQLVLVVSIRL